MTRTKFVDGLYNMDAAQTRARLADAMRMAKSISDPGVATALTTVEIELLAAARKAVLTLQLALDVVAAPVVTGDHHVDILNQLEAEDPSQAPTPVKPAPTAPRMPPLGLRPQPPK